MSLRLYALHGAYDIYFWGCSFICEYPAFGLSCGFIFVVASFTGSLWSRYCAHKANVVRCKNLPLPAPLPLANFSQKFPELPVLHDCSGSSPVSTGVSGQNVLVRACCLF